MNEIALHVNGVLHLLTVDPRTSLLDLLRERLGLTGSKKGCYHGQCGACTALIDGRRANACLALAVAHDGMTMGLGMALMEQTVVDAAQGGFVRRDLAQYHIATCADVQDVTLGQNRTRAQRLPGGLRAYLYPSFLASSSRPILDRPGRSRSLAIS